MKDEIKEILEELESLFEISEAPEHITNGFNKTKDYITNLQEENEMYAQLKDEYEDIIDKAIEKINDLIEVEKKETDYDRFYGDNDYTIKKLKDIKNTLQGENKNV